MSTNLTCEQVELWQTPTWFTWAVNFTYNGGVRDWEDTKYLYIEWVKGHTTGVWDSIEDAEEIVRSIAEHIKELDSHDKLDFKWI